MSASNTIDINSLRKYYNEKGPYQFPFHILMKWCTEGTGCKIIEDRYEFSVVLSCSNFNGWIRYQTISQILAHIQNTRSIPFRIDKGPIWNTSMNQRKELGVMFEPVGGDFKFDIDLSDAIFRICESIHGKKSMCQICMPILHVWILVLNAMLLRILGVEQHQILWVFSGGRGAHCWIKGAQWTTLSQSSRTTFVNLLNCPYQSSILTDHRVIFDEIMSPAFRDDIQFKHHVVSKLNKHMTMEEAIIAYCFPRLDVKVTSDIGHLLKLPFSVHPRTSKICIPIDIDNMHLFNYDSMPSLSDYKSSPQLISSIEYFRNWIENFKRHEQ